MSTTALNFTGRIDLDEHEIQAAYRIEDDVFVLQLRWFLEHYSLSADSTLFIEMKGGSQTSETHRLDLGLLGNGTGERELRIERVRNHDLIKIRFGVVKKNDLGIPMILADRDRISPINSGEGAPSRSFLKMVKVSDLPTPWRVHFEDDEPVLQVTDRSGLYQQLRDSSPLFLLVILPEVVRQIFEWLATTEVDRTSGSIRQWIKYFERFHCPVGFLNQVRERSDEDSWLDVTSNARVVSEEFSKSFKFIDKLADIFTSEEN